MYRTSLITMTTKLLLTLEQYIDHATKVKITISSRYVYTNTHIHGGVFLSMHIYICIMYIYNTHIHFSRPHLHSHSFLPTPREGVPYHPPTQDPQPFLATRQNASEALQATEAPREEGLLRVSSLNSRLI